MSVLLSAASAAALKLAEPRRPILSESDYPRKAQAAHDNGIVIFRAVIDPLGKATDCKIEQVIDNDFGGLVCEHVLSTPFSPARGPDGKPAYGVIRNLVTFWSPGYRELKSIVHGKTRSYLAGRMTPELILATKSTPGVLTERRDVFLAVMMDSEGHVSSCTPLSDKRAEGLTMPACAQATALWTDDVLKNSEGLAVPYVRPLTVEFEPEGAKP